MKGVELSMNHFFIEYIGILCGVCIVIYFVLNIAKNRGKYQYVVMIISILITTATSLMIPAKIEYVKHSMTIKYGFPLKYIKQYKTVSELDGGMPRYTTLFNNNGDSLLGSISFDIMPYVISICLIYVMIKFIDKRLKLIKFKNIK